MSKNMESSFPESLGSVKLVLIGKRFYQRHANAVMVKHHIAIEGTLKQDNSIVNDLSAFSRKA